MRTVRCPSCGQDLTVPNEAGAGHKFSCPYCAGLTLRLEKRGGQFVASEGKKVSCPNCDKVIELPDEAKAGDLVECCGQQFRLTYEWGWFAAEPLA